MMTQTSISLALAGITFLLTLIWGPPLIKVLRRLGIVRLAGADESGDMMTMGGLLFVLPVALLTVLMNFAETTGLTGVGFSILLPLGTMLGFAILGGWMDLRGVRGRHRRGWRDLQNLGGQVALAALIAYILEFVLRAPQMYLPFYKGAFELGLLYLPFAGLTVLATANAFQVTSGVEGLTGLVGATSVAVYGAIALFQEQIFIARFCFTLVGALLGFLWFNIRPATLHMGRAGTYALGAVLSVVALMTGQWPLLVVIAVVPFAEIATYGWLGLRRRGEAPPEPLHAQLLLSGWSRTQVVQRLWLVSLLFAMIGFTLAMV